MLVTVRLTPTISIKILFHRIILVINMLLVRVYFRTFLNVPHVLFSYNFFSLNGEALKHAIITGDIKLLHTDETDSVTENIIRLNLGIPVITENLDAPRNHHRMKNEISFEKSPIPIDRV